MGRESESVVASFKIFHATSICSGMRITIVPCVGSG